MLSTNPKLPAFSGIPSRIRCPPATRPCPGRNISEKQHARREQQILVFATNMKAMHVPNEDEAPTYSARERLWRGIQ